MRYSRLPFLETNVMRVSILANVWTGSSWMTRVRAAILSAIVPETSTVLIQAASDFFCASFSAKREFSWIYNPFIPPIEHSMPEIIWMISLGRNNHLKKNEQGMLNTLQTMTGLQTLNTTTRLFTEVS